MKVYYNDNDPFCCAWLRELIAAKLIPEGDVDERSITDVEPGDVRGYGQCHFFAGIGGWSLALRLAGWPESRSVWTGSCPCQPFSVAGTGKGSGDDRNLWPAFMRLIGERKPGVVFGEQVTGSLGHSWWDRVAADLEAAAYAVGAVVLGAHSVGAPHRRQRLFWVADSIGRGSQVGWSKNNGSISERFEDRETRDLSAETTKQNEGSDGGVADAMPVRTGREHAATTEPGNDGQNDGILRAGSSKSGLGHTELARRAPSRSGQQIDSRRESEPGLLGGGLANPAQRGQRTDRSAPGQPGHAQQREQTGGLGDAECGGRRENHVCQPSGISEGCGRNFWSDAIWVPTRDPRAGETKMRRISPKPSVQSMASGLSYFLGVDWLQGVAQSEGKIRRIQKCAVKIAGGMLSVFPLCEKVPGRVGMLRGAGNTICPETAAEFVKAFLESKA